MYDEIIEKLETNLSFTHGTDITNYDSGYICDIFSEIADSNIDIYTYDLFEWGKNNFDSIDEATKEFGNPNDIIKQIQQGQYYAFEQELYENKNDVMKYFAYNYLKDNEIVITDEQEEMLDDYLSRVDSDERLENIIDYCNDLNKEFDLA